MAAKHKPEYGWPRTGQKRRTRQPFLIDTLPEEVRGEIQRRRAAGQTWPEISAASEKFAGRVLSISVLQRWYDVRVEQVQREVLAQAERARTLAAAFTGKSFKDLPEATMNALAAQVFQVMESKGGADFEESLGSLGLVLAKMIAAQSASKRAEIEGQKIELARKKFEELKSKADKVTNEAAAKIGKGRKLTIEDINRLRERTFGLPPVQRIAAAGHPA